MDSRAATPVRVLLAPLVALLSGALLLAASRVPFAPTSPLAQTLASGFPLEEASIRYARLTLVLLLAGLACLLLAVLQGLGWRRLPAWREQWAGRLSASARAFGRDLGQLLRRLAADRLSLAGLALLTLAGLLVRLWNLSQPMRYDEANTYLATVMPRTLQVFYYGTPNNHVAHSLLVYASTAIFGDAPWAIRLPAFAAGVLLVPMSYLCARTVFRRSAGLLAAGLVAGCPYLVLFATNARGYSQIALLTLALVPLVPYFVRTESGFAGLLIALLSALGLYTIPVMLFPIAALALWSLLLAYHLGGLAKALRVARLLAGTLLLCAVATVLLYTPVAIMSGWRAIVANQYVSPLPLADAMRAWPSMVADTSLRFLKDVPGAIQIAIAGLMLAGAVTLWRANRTAFLLLPAAVVGIGAVLLARRVVPYQRTWIFLLPLSFCLADAGLAGLAGLVRLAGLAGLVHHRPRDVAGGALGLLFALGMGVYLVRTNAVVYYPETGAMPDAEAIALALKPYVQEGDWVLARKNLPLRYYGVLLGMPLDVFRGGGDGDRYVVVQLPRETFERVTRVYGLQLDEEDFVVQEFPTALLYLPHQ
jgi:hypothetical protein